MSLGIYCYIDKKDNNVVYVGKDSHIDKDLRNKQHHYPSFYNDQPFNRALQNNPDRYVYQRIVYNVPDQNTLNELEIHFISQFNPKFNFTDGGDGSTGYKHSNEARKKMSLAKKGSVGYYRGRRLPEEIKLKISKAKQGFKHSEETKKKIKKNNAKYWLGKTRSEETNAKISKANKGKFIGTKHPASLYNLWDNHKVQYNKSKMFRNNRRPNPVNCFRVRYNSEDVNVGGFIDFLTPTLLYNFIKGEDNLGI